MKKILLNGFVALSAATMAMGSLGKVQAQDDENVLRIASHLPPMTDVVEIAADVIAEPYSIELLEVSDNIQYNEAVLHDEAYGSLAQHRPFMEMFNEERDGDLVAIQPIYNAIVGYYSPVYNSLDEIEEGAEVAVPSDITNEARALFVLQQHDLIQLDEAAGLFPTVEDIIDNPLNLQFTHIDLLNLTGAYEDGVELVFNYPTYIASIDLTPEDALFLEQDPENTFAITLVIRQGNQDSQATQALLDAFRSPEVHAFLEDLAKEGHLEPAFDLEGESSEGSEESSLETSEESSEE